MSDPFKILDVPLDADDATIRARYLELVRQFPPEQQPEQFGRIRSAYESIRDFHGRVKYRLFEHGSNETIEAIIEELACRTPRPRITLRDLIAADQKK